MFYSHLLTQRKLKENSYSIMGTASRFFGNVQQKKDNYFRELEFRLKDLGPEHVDVAGSYYDLGAVCYVLGELQQAKDYHGRALDIRLKNLGPEHADVAWSYCELGNVCLVLGELPQAKDYCRRALDIHLKNLGPEHVEVANSYNRLGNVCVVLGELQQAKDYHGRALDIRLKSLGPEHADVACSYNCLGSVYSFLGDLEREKDYSERARNILANENFCGFSAIPIIPKNNSTERADAPFLSKFQAVHSVPPYILTRGSSAKAAYQRALETGKTLDKRAKILLIGQDRVGKTSVLRSLKGELFRQDESSTVGVQIDMPLKHVSEKPWKNSKEEQEKNTFHYKCALNVSNQLLTEPLNEIYVNSEVTKQTETDETQRTEGMIGEIGANVGMYLITNC